MNRTDIEDVLLTMGVPASSKGFIYIADAVEYLEKNGTDISITKDLYPDIAKKRQTTASRVERAIRHGLEVARSERGDFETVDKYIGFTNCANFPSIAMLHKRIKQELESEGEDRKKTGDNFQIENSQLTAFEIRKIIQQELRLFLDEFKELKT